MDVLLESPYGARTEPRMREHFDRLVDRINAHEVTALAQGDGFAEKKYEPASIDELLKIATFPKPAADAATEKAVKDDLAATEHDVPIPQNDRVLAYVELFQGRLRDYIQESLTRGSKYLPMIQGVFKEDGLPLDLAYIPVIESGFKTNALSRASAKGPWQFMRATATEQGLKTDWYIDERSDPEKATIAAAKYLKLLHDMFDRDWHLVLAAYNGGLGRLQRAMKRSGESDFWSLSSSSRYLPKETREYVPLILAAIIVAKNPAQYGFEISAEDPLQFETVTVPRAVDLRRVAEWTGHSIDEIQSLNPELRRWTTPVRSEYELKVPVGTAEKLRTRIASAAPGRALSADVLHGEKRRIDRDNRAEAAGQPRRPRRGEHALDQIEASHGPVARRAARAVHAPRDEPSPGDADRNGLARHHRIGCRAGGRASARAATSNALRGRPRQRRPLPPRR